MPRRKQPGLKKLIGKTRLSYETLSTSEREVLIQLSCGHSNKAIAVSLNISINTVEKYLSNIYRKLGVDSRTEAILWWLKKGTDFRT